MTKKTTRKSGIPKSIRSDVKSLFKHATSSNIQVSFVFVDENTGRTATTTNGTKRLHNLVNQAAGNYAGLRAAEYNGYVAGQKSVTA